MLSGLLRKPFRKGKGTGQTHRMHLITSVSEKMKGEWGRVQSRSCINECLRKNQTMRRIKTNRVKITERECAIHYIHNIYFMHLPRRLLVHATHLFTYCVLAVIFSNNAEESENDNLADTRQRPKVLSKFMSE
jgi:hypothetical protein